MVTVFIIQHRQGGKRALGVEMLDRDIIVRVFMLRDTNDRALFIRPLARINAHPVTRE